MGFMLTRRDIEANPHKFQMVIDMRSQYLIAIFCFFSYTGDKAFLFFVALKRKENFEWTTKCEEVLSKIKEFLTSPPILTRPKEDSPLIFYLSVTKQVMSSILVQEINKVDKLVHFVIEVFKGVETHYLKTEKLILVFVTAVRNL